MSLLPKIDVFYLGFKFNHSLPFIDHGCAGIVDRENVLLYKGYIKL